MIPPHWPVLLPEREVEGRLSRYFGENLSGVLSVSKTSVYLLILPPFTVACARQLHPTLQQHF